MGFKPGAPRMASLAVWAGFAVLSAWVALAYWHAAGVVGGGSLVASDPPAHFTSGVMVYDYVLTAFGSHPVRFAESFYVRYPKVAIGHWPPGYYAVQAAWYALFGVSIWSAQALSAATTAALAWALWRRLPGDCEGRAALGAVLALLSAPLVRMTAWAVMSDLLTGLFVFLAILAFADLLDAPRPGRAAARFALWSALAILTKGTAWALGPFALLAPLLARRAGCYRTAQYWASGATILALAAPFYLVMQEAHLGYPVVPPVAAHPAAGVHPAAGAGGGIDWLKHLAPLRPLFLAIPPLLFGMAALGWADALRARWRKGDDAPATTDALVAGAWLAAQAIFSFVLPLTHEGRALLPSLAPAALLMARALGRAESVWHRESAAAIPLLVAALAVLGMKDIPMNRVEGYRAAASALPYPPEGALMLVSSDPPGEGAFIVERLAHDRQRAGVVLRAGQLLGESDWMGREYRPFFDSAEKIREYLKALPVRYVLIDGSAGAEAPPGQELLRQAVEGDPANFLPVGRFPVTDLTGDRRGEIRVYENPAAATRHPETLRVRLGTERSGRVLEYRWR